MVRKGLCRNKLCNLAAVAGCDARRATRRSASTASGAQRSSAPAATSKIVQFIPAQTLRPQTVVNSRRCNRRLPHRHRDLVQSGNDITGCIQIVDRGLLVRIDDQATFCCARRAQQLGKAGIDDRAECRIENLESLLRAVLQLYTHAVCFAEAKPRDRFVYYA